MDDLNAKRKASDHVNGLVKDFRDKFQIIYDDFAKDYKQAHDDITSKNEELQQLTAKKSSLQAEANADHWKSLIPFAGTYFAIQYSHLEQQIYDNI